MEKWQEPETGESDFRIELTYQGGTYVFSTDKTGEERMKEFAEWVGSQGFDPDFALVITEMVTMVMPE